MKTIRLSIAAKLIIFIAITEFIIMLIFAYVKIIKQSPFLEAFLDTIILGFIIIFGLNFLLSRPLRKIIQAMEEVGKKNLDVTLELKQMDEIGQLAKNFNQMASSLKNAEEEKRQRNQFIETITQGIEEELILLDADLKILWANKKALESFGVKMGEVIDNYCYLKDESSTRPHELCAISKAIDNGRPNTVLHTRSDKEGNKFYAEVSVYPVRDSKGESVRFIHVTHDVTEKMKMIEELKTAKNKIEEYSRTLENKVTERTRDLMESIKEADERRLAITNMLEDINEAHRELRQANKELKEAQAKLVQSAKMAAVGQLAGGVAHEINNPLTGVLNNVQLIKMELAQNKECSATDFKELLDVVEESAQRCRVIVRTLLDFSRAGKGPHQPIDINEVLDKMLFIAETEIRIGNIKLTKEYSPNLPEIMGDSNQLQQAFLDIFNNAKWAMAMRANQGAELKIKTFLSNDSKFVVTEISDNGCGIEKENLNRIFEPFFTTKKPGEGTGLGLSICYGIIKEHNGAIEAESEGKDKGATFRVSLPV